MTIYVLPDAVIAILFVAVSVGVALAGLTLFRRLLPEEAIQQHTQIASSLYGMVALLYAVIVGSLVASGWTRFSQAQTSLVNETNALGNLFRATEAFDPALRTQLRQGLLAYAEEVLNVEWPRMREDEPVVLTSQSYERLWSLYIGAPELDGRAATFYSNSITQLTNLSNERRVRISLAVSGYSNELWVLFVCGGAVVIFFSYFYAPKRSMHHLLLLTLLAGMFGFVLYLLFQIQTPYAGDLSVSADVLARLVETWRSQTGPYV